MNYATYQYKFKFDFYAFILKRRIILVQPLICDFFLILSGCRTNMPDILI